jgi:hypothetical protein
MFAMGGVVWVTSRLPSRRAQRLARVQERLATLQRLRAMTDERGDRALSSAWLELEIEQQEQRLEGLRALLDRVEVQAPVLSR